jgi:hypothetical protein
MGNLFGIILGVVLFVAWLNHILFCFATAAWGFLLAGAIFFPIGVLHGMWLWGQ